MVKRWDAATLNKESQGNQNWKIFDCTIGIISGGELKCAIQVWVCGKESGRHPRSRTRQGKERNGRFECSVPRAGLVVFVLSGEAKDIEVDPEESLAISPV